MRIMPLMVVPLLSAICCSCSCMCGDKKTEDRMVLDAAFLGDIAINLLSMALYYPKRNVYIEKIGIYIFYI